jgi:hypothetical protein
MNHKDKIKAKSNIKITIVDVKTNKVIDVQYFKNLLTTDGYKTLQAWAAGTPPATDPNYNVDTRINKFAVGDSNTTPDISQTGLGNELLRKTLYPAGSADIGCGITLEDNDKVVYTILIDETELNGEIIREMGLFSSTFSPTIMLSRFLTGNLEKIDSVRFIIEYTYQFINT